MKALDDLAEQLRNLQSSAITSNGDWRPLPLGEMRSIHIHRVLETCNGYRVRAATMLGIGRTSLYRFLKSVDKQSAVQAGAQNGVSFIQRANHARETSIGERMRPSRRLVAAGSVRRVMQQRCGKRQG
jgi:DNA-binding protein Fis